MKLRTSVLSEQLYAAGLYDYFLLKKWLIESKQFSVAGSYRIKAPNGEIFTDQVPFPQYYLIAQHTISFIEKMLKMILCLRRQAITEFELKKLNHHLGQVITELKNAKVRVQRFNIMAKLSIDARNLLGQLSAVKYSPLRYLSNPMEILFSPFSFEQLVSEVMEIVAQMRVKLYQSQIKLQKGGEIEVVSTVLKTAPKRISEPIFIKICEALDPKNKQFLQNKYIHKKSYFLLKTRVSSETGLQIYEIIAKHSSLWFEDEVSLKIS